MNSLGDLTDINPMDLDYKPESKNPEWRNPECSKIPKDQNPEI